MCTPRPSTRDKAKTYKSLSELQKNRDHYVNCYLREKKFSNTLCILSYVTYCFLKNKTQTANIRTLYIIHLKNSFTHDPERQNPAASQWRNHSPRSAESLLSRRPLINSWVASPLPPPHPPFLSSVNAPLMRTEERAHYRGQRDRPREVSWPRPRINSREPARLENRTRQRPEWPVVPVKFLVEKLRMSFELRALGLFRVFFEGSSGIIL